MTRCNVELEVCVDSLDSAFAAQAGGAARIELCDALIVGGTTPSFGLLELVRQRVKLPIYVLIRPRAGDFCYSDNELVVMERDIAVAKSLGADGIVCGALRSDGTVDIPTMARLVAITRPLSFTFHRAFDMTRDPRAALDELMVLGVERVLTSGQEQSAILGIDLIRDLVRQADGRISIMPGGGITEENAGALVAATGVSEIHASARRHVDSRMAFRREGLSMGAWPEDEYRYSFADPERVQAIIRAANGLQLS